MRATEPTNGKDAMTTARTVKPAVGANYKDGSHQLLSNDDGLFNRCKCGWAVPEGTDLASVGKDRPTKRKTLKPGWHKGKV